MTVRVKVGSDGEGESDGKCARVVRRVRIGGLGVRVTLSVRVMVGVRVRVRARIPWLADAAAGVSHCIS